MLTKVSAKWVRVALVALVAVLMLMLVGSEASAADRCQKVAGMFTLQPVTEGCTSPVGICATGVYRGVISATSSFTGSSVTTTADTPTTSVILLTGDNRIETRNGALMTKDAIVLQTTGDGDFAEVDTIVGGTGAWAGATGTLKAVGVFGASGGEGTYVGQVCKP